MAQLTVNPTEDTYLDTSNSSTNYGSATLLGVRRWSSGSAMTALIMFDLSSIPAGATVDSAYLRVTGNNSGNARDIIAYRCLVDWDADQATWDDRLTSTAWNTAGGQGSGTDRSATLMGEVSLGATANVEVEMTLDNDEMELMIANNYGFVMTIDEDASSIDKNIYSVDHGTSSRHPELEVNYSTGATIGVNTVTLASSTPSSAIVPGEYTALMSALTLATSPQNTTLVPGSVTITMWLKVCMGS